MLLSHFISALVCFHFVSMERVNFRVYNAHSVAREARRSGHCCVTYRSLSLSFPLSLSLPPCRLVQQCLMEKRWTVKKYEEEKRRRKIERLLCAKQLLMRRNCNINTGRSCEVDDGLMAPISHHVLEALSGTHPSMCDD